MNIFTCGNCKHFIRRKEWKTPLSGECIYPIPFSVINSMKSQVVMHLHEGCPCHSELRRNPNE